MPNWEPNAFGYTIPNPFFGGAVSPPLAFGALFAWPWIERFATDDRAEHHLLDRPHDAPWRTACGAAFFTWVLVPFVAGSADRLFVGLDIPYEGQILVLRLLWLLLPAVVYAATLMRCRTTQRRRRRPPGRGPLVMRRGPSAGFQPVVGERTADRGGSA